MWHPDTTLAKKQLLALALALALSPAPAFSLLFSRAFSLARVHGPNTPMLALGPYT
jgi:hypothetical protein